MLSSVFRESYCKAAQTPHFIFFEHAVKLEPVAVFDHVCMYRCDKQRPDTAQRRMLWVGMAAGRDAVKLGDWKPVMCYAGNSFLHLLFWYSKTACYGELF